MEPGISRDHFSITDHQGAAAEDRAYWHNASFEERWQAVELQRMIAYGYVTAPRLQRDFFEIVDLRINKAAAGRNKDLADLEQLPKS